MKTEEKDKKDTTGSMLCLFYLIIVGVVAIKSNMDFIPVAAVILATSFLYFLYYLLYTGQFVEIIVGIITSIILMGIAMAIPFIGEILILLWVLYNIKMSLQSIKNLLPDAVWSLFLWGALFIPTINEYRTYHIFFYSGYFVLSFAYCGGLMNQRLDTRTVLFKMSVMWISIPFIALLIVSIISSLRSIFSFKTIINSSEFKNPQQVSGYQRGSSYVEGYTRQINRTMTTATTCLSPSTGAITSSITKSMAAVADTPSSNFSVSSTFSSNKELKFYRFDDLDYKKVTNFIKSIGKIDSIPTISIDDVVFYFDDTLFGKGDHGVVITREFVIYNGGKLYGQFHIDIKNIVDVSISGLIDKTIKIKTTSGFTHKLEINQSNKGAELIHKVLNESIS